MDRLPSLDEFDWSDSTAQSPAPSGPSIPPPTRSLDERRDRSVYLPREPSVRAEFLPPGDDKLPPVYKYRKELRRDRPMGKRNLPSIDDLYADSPSVLAPAKPQGWAPIRGWKAGWQTSEDSLAGVATMAKLSTMDEQSQVAEMLKLGKAPADPKIQLTEFTDIRGPMDALRWIGESIGQMGGSVSGAAVYGGGTGAVTGAGIGGTAGSLAGGAGALPGALAGGVTGFGYGTMTAFGAMGVGEMFNDLLHDEGVQQALQAGTIKPNDVKQLAVGFGSVIGALDALPIAKLAGKFKDGGKEVVKRSIKEALKAGLKNAGVEGGTEAMQGAISEIGQALQGGNINMLERTLSVLNQGAAGAVGGGAFGSAADYASQRVKPRPNTANPAPPAGSSGPTLTPTSPAGSPAGSSTPGGLGTTPPPPPTSGTPRTSPQSYPTKPNTSPSIIPKSRAPSVGGSTPAKPSTGILSQVATEGITPTAEAAPAVPAPAAAASGVDPTLLAATTATQPKAPRKPKAPTTINTPVVGTPSPATPSAVTPEPLSPPTVGTAAIESPDILSPATPSITPQATPSAVGATGEETPQAVLTPAVSPELSAAAAQQPGEAAAVSTLSGNAAVADQPAVAPSPPKAAVGTEPAAAPPAAAGLPEAAAEAEVPRQVIKGRMPSLDELYGPELLGTAPAPQPALQESEEAVASIPEPAPKKRAPRPSIRLKPRPAEKPRPATFSTGEAKTLRITPAMFRNAGPEAVARISKRIADAIAAGREVTARSEKTRKKRGTIVSAGDTLSVSWQPEPIGPRREAVEYQPTAEDTDRRRREATKVREKVAALRKKVRTLVSYKGGQQIKRYVADEAALREAAELERQLEKPPAWLRKKAKQASRAADPGIEGFYAEHIIEIPEGHVEYRQETPAVQRLSPQQRALAVLRDYFEGGGKDAVSLRSVGMPVERIRELEAAGMAEDGSMDPAEYQRWKNHRYGIEAAPLPPRPARPPSAAEQKKARREKFLADREARKKRLEAEREDRQRGFSRHLRREGEKKLQEKEARWTKFGIMPPPQERKSLLTQAVEQELRSSTALSHLDIGAREPTDVARETTAAFNSTGKGSPFDIMRQHTMELVNKAINTIGTRGVELTRALERIADEQHKNAIALAEWRDRDVVKRTTKEGYKDAKSIAEEDWSNTFKLAKKAYADQQDGKEADPILAEMGKNLTIYGQMSKKPKGETKEQAKVRVAGKQAFLMLAHQGQKKRIAAAKVTDRELANAARRDELEMRRAKERLAKDLGQLVDKGLIDETDAHRIIESVNNDAKHATKVKRARKTTPLIRKAFDDQPLPAGFEDIEARLRVRGEWRSTNARPMSKKNIAGKPGIGSIAERANFYGLVREWADRFTAAVEQALQDAGITLPERMDRVTNTHEENVYMFIKNRAAKLAERVKPTANNVLQRGQGLAEVYTVAQLMSKPAKSRLTAAERWLQQQQDGDIIYGQIFDADPVLGQVRAADINDPAVERAATDLGFTPAKTVRRYESPFEVPRSARRRTLAEGSRMTGTEALDRFTRGWKSRQKGWRRLLRAAVLRSVRRLVGDVEVQIVASDFMNDMIGRRTAGFYHPTSHKIYLNEEALDNAEVMDDTIVEEMVHAATAYSLRHNINGTRDLVSGLMKEFRKQFGEGHELGDYALQSPEEFMANAMRSSELQHILQSLPVSVKQRAKIRAMLGGRQSETWWDVVVSTIEKLLGMNGHSMMDQMLRIYPHTAMSSRQQMADREERDIDDDGSLDMLASPFSVDAMANFVKTKVVADKGRFGRRAFNRLLAPLEGMKAKAAQDFFGGDMNNPLSDYADAAILSAKRRVEAEMRPGQQLDTDIMEWVSQDHETRYAQLGDGLAVMRESSLDNVDPRKPISAQPWIRDDALHPTKRGRGRKTTMRHKKDTAMRQVWALRKAEWDALPSELQQMLSDRADMMSEQMAKTDRKLIRNILRAMMKKENHAVVLPAGMSEQTAVDQIYNDAIDPALEAALGKNADTLRHSVSRVAERGKLYFPASRSGEYFISGRRKIPLPQVTRGEVVFDQHNFDRDGRYNFIFSDLQDAVDYQADVTTSGEERTIGKIKTVYINPITGEKVPSIDHGHINGVDWQATPIHYLRMQDRFMEMGDSVQALEGRRDELYASGKYERVSDPVLLDDSKVESIGALPMQLATMINNINGMKGISESEKSAIRSGVISSFARSQQGNRISKRLLKRTAVHGYQKETPEMLAALNTNNEMLSRHSVSLDRMPEISEAERQMKDFIEVAKGGDRSLIANLPQNLQRILQSEYGKADKPDVSKLSADFAEIQRRFQKSLMPGRVEALLRRFGGEKAVNALQSIVVLKYLGSPAYYALQAMGMWMQSYPSMVKQMWPQHGMASFTLAFRYLNKAMADVGYARNLGRTAAEGMAEFGTLLKGLKPRKGYLTPRHRRRPHDYIEEQKQRLAGAGGKYTAEKLAAIEHAHALGFIGQAGLDQQNLLSNISDPTVTNKFMRGIEGSTLAFRAFQEGIEINNRLVPMLAMVEYYSDIGMDAPQAVRKAVSNMVSEQVGYQKENWPSWMSSPLAMPAVLFHKFAYQQAINFWGSMRELAFEPGQRGAAAVHLLTMSAMLMAVGGASGNPVWEPIKLLLYLLGVVDNWDSTTGAGERWMADYIGKDWSEAAMYGLPRLLGIDMSSRVAMDNTLFFKEPKEQTPDEWLKVIGSMMAGAPGDAVLKAGFALRDGIQGGGADSLSSIAGALPLPKLLTDTLKAADVYENGPSTVTGVRTGPPVGVAAAAANALGFRTRVQSRPFEQGSAAKQRDERIASARKSELIQGVLANGMTSSNARLIRNFNAGLPPKDRITMKKISDARKRRRKLERDITKENLGAM